jgi:hypothetical protein
MFKLHVSSSFPVFISMSKSLPTVTIFKDGHSHVKGNDNNNDEAYGTLIAQAVDVEEIDVGWTRSKQLWKPFTARGVFGGQVYVNSCDYIASVDTFLTCIVLNRWLLKHLWPLPRQLRVISRCIPYTHTSFYL